METWRRVEVAACEELSWLLGDSGPSAAELDAARQAGFTVEAVNEREKVTDHDVAAFVDVLSASAGPAGRWLHFGLTSSDVLDTALALQLNAAAGPILEGAAGLVAVLAARAREHAGTLTAGRTHGIHAEPTTFGVKLAGFGIRGEPQPRTTARRVRGRTRRRALRHRGDLLGDGPRVSSAACSRRLGLRPEHVSTQVVAARPPRRAAPGDRARRRGPRALRDRDPPPAAHRGARGRRAVPRRGEGLLRDAAQAQPESRERICGLARVLRADALAGSRTSPSGTSATSRTPPPSGSILPDTSSCSTTCSTA